MNNSVRVGNLDNRISNDDLRHLFSRFGAIANIQTFANGVVNRFAVIVFYDKD